MRKTKKTETTYAAMLHIGGPDRLAVKEAADAIARILEANCGDQPKAEAMITLRALAQAPSHVNVANNSFVNNK